MDSIIHECDNDSTNNSNEQQQQHYHNTQQQQQQGLEQQYDYEQQQQQNQQSLLATTAVIDEQEQQPKETQSPHGSSSYALGLVFIVAVSVIWSASSVLVQYIYEWNDTANGGGDTKKSSLTPFLVTYIGVSLFSIFLPAQFLYETIRRFICYYCCCRTNEGDDNDDATKHRRHHHPATTTVTDAVVDYYQHHHHPIHSYETIPTIPTSPSDGATTTRAVVVIVPDVVVNDTASTTTTTPNANRVWTRRDYLITAFQIAPVWFGANWAYNGSLLYTTITSSTVLASTSSLFTFLLAFLAKDENFTFLKLMGVLLGVSGSILTTLNDTSESSSSNNNTTALVNPTRTLMMIATSLDDNYHRILGDDVSNHPQVDRAHVVIGDFFAICAAIGYAGYAVQTRVLCPKDESLYEMQLVLGYIGFVCMIGLSPLAIYELYFSGHAALGWGTFGALVIKGLFDNVLSDYLWLRAVVLTNATVATVGLGLTIPLAFLSDIFKGNGTKVLRMNSLLGATAVLLGFLFVNLANQDDNMNIDDTDEIDDENEEEEVENGFDESNNDGQNDITSILENASRSRSFEHHHHPGDRRHIIIHPPEKSPLVVSASTSSITSITSNNSNTTGSRRASNIIMGQQPRHPVHLSFSSIPDEFDDHNDDDMENDSSQRALL